MARIVIANGVTEVDVEEVVVGSSFQMGLYVEGVTIDGVVPFNFAAVEFDADVREYHNAPGAPVTSFVVTARTGSPGWIDLVLDATKTALLTDAIDYQASVKVWPVDEEEKAVTLIKMTLHVSQLATR